MEWQHISPEVIVKDFKKCFISNAVDETDDDMLWNDSEVRREGCQGGSDYEEETKTLVGKGR